MILSTMRMMLASWYGRVAATMNTIKGKLIVYGAAAAG